MKLLKRAEILLIQRTEIDPAALLKEACIMPPPKA
jgi:hypothetical protein